MKGKLALLLIFIICSSFQAKPPLLTWRVLEKIDFEEKYVEMVQGKMLFPKFPAHIKQYNGKQVQVVGYAVPLDNSGTTIALSANPYEACFFCGKAGPASVMTIRLKKKNKEYRIDDYVAFVGKLKLNTDDINEFYYILENAEQVGVK
jgi:hypothetical protein